MSQPPLNVLGSPVAVSTGVVVTTASITVPMTHPTAADFHQLQQFRLPPPVSGGSNFDHFYAQQPVGDGTRHQSPMTRISQQQPSGQISIPPIFTTRMTSQQQQVSPHFGPPQNQPIGVHQPRYQGPPHSSVSQQQQAGLMVTTVPQPQGASPLISHAVCPPTSQTTSVRHQILIGGSQNEFGHTSTNFQSSGDGRMPQRLPAPFPDQTASTGSTAAPKPKPKKSKPKKPPVKPIVSTAASGNSVSSVLITHSAVTDGPVGPASVVTQVPVPKPKPPRKKPSQSAGTKKLSAAALKLQEEDMKYRRKYQLLKRSIKALVFKNAALCDEVARLNQRIHTVTEERKVLLKRIFHHERLKQKKIAAAQRRLAAQAKNSQQATTTTTADIQPTETKPEDKGL